MADLRIVDAPEIPTNNITGREKIPTGGSGNYSITLDSLANYAKTKKDLADNTAVDNKVNGVRQELDDHIQDLTNPHQVTKGQIGLGNVDNTADLDKPVSNSTQAAIISAVTPKADKTYVDSKLEYSLLNNKITRTLYDKLYESWSIKDFGAIGDGTLHTLQELVDQGKFSGLAAIQVVFPFVTSLTESIDRVAIQGAISALPLNTASTGILTPKGFANGGCIHVPRGRYKFDKPIKLKRGTRIDGESKEATQLICASPNGLFIFEDDGGYIPDEIGLSNLSIWQDESVTPTSGAGLTVAEGAYTTGIQFKLENVHIEGTYKGFEAISGIGCSLIGVTTSRCISHGIDINSKGNNAKSTTSTTLLNCYSFLNGGNGINVVGSSYLSIIGCASDSNSGTGYNIVGANTIFINGGAERNTVSNVYIKDVSSGFVKVHSVQHDGTGHAITLNNSNGVSLYTCGLSRSGTNTGKAIYFEASPKTVQVVNPTVNGYSIVDLTNNINYLNIIGMTGSLTGGSIKGGSTNNWTYGAVLNVDTTSQLAIVGNTESTTRYGLKVSPTFTTVDATYNSASLSQFISTSAASVTNYNLAIGHYIENAFLGSNTTTTRTAGQYIKEQTRGSTANANLMIDGGQGTVPAGQWSIYNGSAKANYHGGSMTWKPLAYATPSDNGDMTFELTSDTQLKIKVKGSDGVVRMTSLTLA